MMWDDLQNFVMNFAQQHQSQEEEEKQENE
jgi:hypothetical protein